jgi:hypothetical protein
MAWLRNRRTQRTAQRFDSGWNWAAGQLLRGASEDDVQNQIDVGCFLDTAPDAFDIGARAAVNAHIAHAYLEAQYKPFNPIC